MCGIWGILPSKGSFVKGDLDIVEQIMILTSLRGKDSTGVAVISSGKPRVIKAVGAPAFLLNLDAWEKVKEFSLKKGVAMFGHGRFATLGDIIAKNAHPHTVDHITLVHNGTITYGLDDDMKAMDTDNDSLGLCHAIAKRGITKALSGLVGAYAIIGYDSKLGKMFVVNNGERPLHQVKFLGNTIIMSEERACEFLAVRNSYSNYKPEITYFPKHAIYWLDPNTEEITIDKSLEETERKKYVPPIPKFGTVIGGGMPSRHTESGNVVQYVQKETKLMCSNIEPFGSNSNMFKYYFVSEDDNNEEVVALSSTYQMERLGAFATTKEIGTLADGKDTQRFVKFRDLEWEPKERETPVKEEEDQPGELVRFQNGHKLLKGEAQKILQREDCALCQRSIDKDEISDTIITTNKTLICKDCITQGRHFAFGFGQ